MHRPATTRMIALLALGLSLAGCDRLGDPHERGRRALEQGDFGSAVKYYSQAIERGEYLAEAYTNRGIANEARGDYEDAIADYDRALEHAPTEAQRAEILNNRGVAWLGRRETAEALDDFAAAIDLDEDYAEAYANWGRALVDREEWEAAIEKLDHSIDIDPKLAEAFGNRALAYESLGDDEQATRDYTEAISLSQDPQAYFNRGMLRYTLGCFDLAYKDFSAVVERLPEDEYLWYMAKSQKDFLEGRPKGADSCLGLERDGDLDDAAAGDEDGSGTDESGTDESGTDESGTDESGTDESGTPSGDDAQSPDDATDESAGGAATSEDEG